MTENVRYEGPVRGRPYHVPTVAQMGPAEPAATAVQMFQELTDLRLAVDALQAAVADIAARMGRR